MSAQGVDSAAPQAPGGSAAGSSGDSGDSSGSDNTENSDDAARRDRDKSNNGHHHGQIRNGNNGRNRS
jgi:hypothetical protein